MVGNSGFNNDSILNVSGNQVPLQACNNDVPVNGGVGVLQLVGEDISAAAGLLGSPNSGSATTNDNRACTQTPSQANPNTLDSTSSN
jgi:hypothetical protein